MRRLGPVALALLAACSRHDVVPDHLPSLATDPVWDVCPLFLPVTWRMDCDLPPEARADVRDGFDYWDRQTDVALFREVGCRERAQVEVSWSPRDYEIPTWWAGTTLRTHVGAWAGAHVVFYRPFFLSALEQEAAALPPQYAGHPFHRSVTRHEVGHVLGLEHLPDDTCVMYEWVNGPEHRYLDTAKGLCDRERKAFEGYYGGREDGVRPR